MYKQGCGTGFCVQEDIDLAFNYKNIKNALCGKSVKIRGFPPGFEGKRFEIKRILTIEMK